MSRFRVMYPLKTFDGGLNNKYEPNAIMDNQSPSCLNVAFDTVGAVGTRKGSTKLNTLSVGTYSCDGLYTCKYNNGNTTMIAWFGGTVYTVIGTTPTAIASGTSVYTANERMCFATYQNLHFMCNGYGTPYKYNGAEFTRHGITTPQSSPVCSQVSDGTLTGTYQYKISYINSYSVVGDVSSASTQYTVASKAIGLVVPIAPQSYGVDARRIYRTINSGTTFLYLTELTNNTATTYIDNIDDSALSTSAPVDVGYPYSYKAIIRHQERLFYIKHDSSYLYYSELGEPFTFPSSDFIKVGDGDGELCKGLSISGDNLLILKDNSIYLLYMPDSDPTNWGLIKTNAKFGAVNHGSIVEYADRVGFIGKKNDKPTGFYAVEAGTIDGSQTNLTLININSDSKSDTIEPDISNINLSYLHKISSVDYDNKVYVSVPYLTSTYNNRIYMYDYSRRDLPEGMGAFVPWTGMNAACFAVYEGDLYYGSADTLGHIYKMEQSVYSDNGTAIDSYLYTKEFEGHKEHYDYVKDFRYAHFTCETLGDWTMDIGYIIDSEIEGLNKVQISLNPGGTLWGAFLWGIGTWGGGETRANYKIELGTSVGKKIQFYFSNQNTVNQAFKVLKGNYYYNLRGLR